VDVRKSGISILFRSPAAEQRLCPRPGLSFKPISQAGHPTPTYTPLAIAKFRVLANPKASAFGAYPSPRNASGVQIRGNATLGGPKAKRSYDSGTKPAVGAVQWRFKGHRANPMGHVAVVSEVVSPARIKVDHATGSATRSRWP